MQRAVVVIIATLGGLLLLASFHTSPGVSTRTVTRAPSTSQPPAGAAPPTTPPTGTHAGSTGPGATTPPATTPPTVANRTVVGPVESNQYGDVQVQIVVRNGQLADVQALELPSDRRRSQEISDYAEPYLQQEALQARSANIEIVSGATYTSMSYAQSLQGALDQAGL